MRSVKAVEQKALDLILANQEAQQALADAKSRARLVRQERERELEALRGELAELRVPCAKDSGRQAALLAPARDDQAAQLQRLIASLHGELTQKSGRGGDPERGGEEQMLVLREIESGMLVLLKRTLLAGRASEETQRKRQEIRKRIPKIIEQIHQQEEAKKLKPKAARPVMPRMYFRVRRDTFRYHLLPRLAAQEGAEAARRVEVEDAHFK